MTIILISFFNISVFKVDGMADRNRMAHNKYKYKVMKILLTAVE